MPSLGLEFDAVDRKNSQEERQDMIQYDTVISQIQHNFYISIINMPSVSSTSTTRQLCVDERPRSSKLTEFINQKKAQSRANPPCKTSLSPTQKVALPQPEVWSSSSPPYEINMKKEVFFHSEDESYFSAPLEEIKKVRTVTEDDRRIIYKERSLLSKKETPVQGTTSKFGTISALDYYPTTFRDYEAQRSDTATTRRLSLNIKRQISPHAACDMTPQKLRTNMRSMSLTEYSTRKTPDRNQSAQSFHTLRSVLNSIPKYARHRPSSLS